MMNLRSQAILEYSKILDRLAGYAGSEPGRAICRALEPSTDISDIRRSQAETSDAAARVRMKGTLSFAGVSDIRASLKRLEVGGTLGTAELLAVSSLLTAAARARAYGHRETSGDIPDDSLDEMFRGLSPLTPINNEIKRCILEEDEIADDASPGLLGVRRSMKTIEGRVHTRLNQMLNSYRTFLQDDVITMRDGRYCLSVKTENKNQVPGMIHDQSSSGSTLFIEPMAVVELNNELRELELREQHEIELILEDLSGRLADEVPALETDLSVLSHLDFVFAKAALSRSERASEPGFNEDGRIALNNARHPLLDPETVVPVTVRLGDGFSLLIITGPNTGGKTVSLKTVGLLTLMGQSGLHIPADENSELAVFTEVFADIGDEQSIEQSLSTFSAHMTNLIDILSKADGHSLCLLDELCSGTDPVEGAALAIAILDSLREKGCRVMATTHYSELKLYAMSTEGVQNASVEFNVQSLQPTYRLIIGLPGKSNAFAISQRLGLSESILADAQSHMESEDETFEDILGQLEESRKELDAERASIEVTKADIAKRDENLRQKEEQLESRREKIIRNANEEAAGILREAKETADTAINNINRMAGSSGIDKKALEEERSRIREGIKKNDKGRGEKKQEGPHEAVNPKTLRVGTAVHVIPLNLDGTVSSLPDARGNLFVQMGILRSQVNIKDLELIPEETVTGPGITPRGKKSSGSDIKMAKSASVSPEINLIGMTVDEAIPVLDKYLDDALIAHLDEVRVVHGKGTGALRNGIHRHLKKLKNVKGFHLAEFGEGDAGVTIVELG